VAKIPDLRIGSPLTVPHSGGTDMPHFVRIGLVLFLVASFAGCVSRTHPPSASDTVAIETPANVAGVWKGNVWRVSHLWTDGDLLVSIAPRGSYVTWSNRGPTPAADAGRLLVIDGKLIPAAPRLLSTVTVVQSHGEPTLVAEVTGKDGDHYYVPLSR
jgi:hypothetical protein